ncbi:MAG: factor-independent urate hydroxylase [Acidobacteriota bacterium]
MTELTDNAYGKSNIHLFRVTRGASRHEVRDFTVGIRFSGAYQTAYCEGDNSHVLPTDTMKNTVYGLAKELPSSEPEDFALALARHFAAGNAEAHQVRVDIAERKWDRLGDLPGHPHGFTPSGGGKHLASATVAGTRATIESGVSDLVLLKTTDSGFADFRKDRFTTLPETSDRILATTVEARWSYLAEGTIDYGATWHEVNEHLRAGFTAAYSPSVQQTLWAMGKCVLDTCPAIAQIHLRLPNLHHLPVDLSPFGLEGKGEIFVATEAPFGLIEGTVRR